MFFDNFRDQQFQTRKLYNKKEEGLKFRDRIYQLLGILVWFLAMVAGIVILAISILWDRFVDVFTILLILGVSFGIWRFKK